MLLVGLFAAMPLLIGCATARLNSARRDFYGGHMGAAAAQLDDIPGDKTDKVLVLMERGMIRQAAGDYRGSAIDWLRAAELIEQLDYLSVSRGAASMLTSDRVISFRGLPYERTLLHAFAAKSYFAMARWDDAAVEARNIISNLENLNGFPDDAYSRYLSGFCLELTGDADNASRQYRAASDLLETVRVDPDTGRLSLASTTNRPPPNTEHRTPNTELVCFVSMGRAPVETESHRNAPRWNPPAYADLYAGDRYLGRSFPLADTRRLLAASEQRLAALRITKDVSRIVLKDVVASKVAEKNDLLGGLLWIALFSFEARAERRWETLPLLLQVARVPCPADLDAYRVVFRAADGGVMRQKTVAAPLTRRGNTFVSFCRDLP